MDRKPRSEEEDEPHMADGGFAGDFDVDSGDSNTLKGLPLDPSAVPAPQPPAAAPVLPPMVPKPAPMAAPAAPVAPARPLPGMPPGITPDELKGYLDKQRSAIGKYSPDRQFDTEQAMLKGRTGVMGNLANAGATFADALMQGVAGKGNPGFASQLNERQNQLATQSAGAMERARKGTMEQTEAGQKIDMQDAKSPLSQAYQKAFGPIFSKMGYAPNAVGSMPASQINTVADLGVRYADAQTQLELKKAMLQVQLLTANATIANQREERGQEEKKLRETAAEQTLKGSSIPFVGPSHGQKRAASDFLANLSTGTNGGHGGSAPAAGPYGAETQRNGKTYEWSPATGKYHLKQ